MKGKYKKGNDYCPCDMDLVGCGLKCNCGKWKNECGKLPKPNKSDILKDSEEL